MNVKIRNLVLEVVSFEKKKTVLPVLMVSILLLSVAYGLHLRDSQSLDEKMTDKSRSVMANLTIIQLESDYFPVKSGINNQTSLRESQERINENTDLSFSKKNKIMLAPAIFALGTDTYPFTPGNNLDDLYLEDNSQSILFPFKDGYVATKEQVTSLSEIMYMQKEFENLEQRLNSTNMSYSEFQAEISEIKSVSYADSELRQSLFKDGLPERMNNFPNELNDNFRQDNWKELQLIHFIPSAIATFVLYYLLSGIAVVSYRRISRNLFL